jgi:predicted MFS family arabinose efflux permease
LAIFLISLKQIEHDTGEHKVASLLKQPLISFCLIKILGAFLNKPIKITTISKHSQLVFAHFCNNQPKSKVLMIMAMASKTRLFILLLGIFMLGLTDVQILAPILPKLAQEFSVTVAVMGTAVSAYAIAAALWALVVGPLSDRIGRLIFLRAAAFVFAGAAIIAYFAMRFEHYVAARIFAGLAGGTISACVFAQAADLFDYTARGRAMGWLGAIYFIAAVIAVPLGAWITAAWGWRVLYLLLAGSAFQLAMLIRPTLRLRRHHTIPPIPHPPISSP